LGEIRNGSIASLLFVASLYIFSATGASAADLEMHSGPLPIPEGKFGDSAGCLMLLGDQPDGPALSLTPREIDLPNSHCDILTWEKDNLSGLLSVDCENRKFLILPQSEAQHRLLVIELTSEQSFTTYELAACEPE
jgi:hypothetical protein